MKKRSGDSSRLGDVSEMLMQNPPLGTPLDWENPLNDGVLMHLAMNEGHGDKVQDLSMNGNHGTLNNFAFPPNVSSGWNPGQSGAGLNFDGTDDYIDCGNNASLDLGTEDFTVATCFKKDVADSFIDILGKSTGAIPGGATAETGFAFLTTNNANGNAFYFSIADGTNSNAGHLDTGTFPSVYTVAIVVVRRHEGTMVCYRNGEKSPLIDISAVTGSLSCAPPLTIGDSNQWPGTFDGNIDQTRIMNRAWSAKEARDYIINPRQVYLQ